MKKFSKFFLSLGITFNLAAQVQAASICKTKLYPSFSEETRRAKYLAASIPLKLKYCQEMPSPNPYCQDLVNLAFFSKDLLIQQLFLDTAFWLRLREIEQSYLPFDKSSDRATYYFSNTLMLQRSTLINQTISDGRPIKTVFIGDSLMHFFENSSGPQQFPDGLFLGISGDRTDSLLFRLAAHVSLLKPENVVISISGNDILQGCSENDRINNRKLIVDILKGFGVKRIIWMALPPLDNAQMAAQARRENGVLSKQAQVEFLDSYTPMLGPNGRIKPQYQGDGTHFNRMGYEEVWIPLLKQAGL